MDNNGKQGGGEKEPPDPGWGRASTLGGEETTLSAGSEGNIPERSSLVSKSTWGTLGGVGVGGSLGCGQDVSASLE